MRPYSALSLPRLSPAPPWAAPLPTGCWVHFQHSLSTSSQWQWICLFVLFLFLCLFPFAQVRLLLCSLCFLHKYKCLVFLLFCVLLPLISSAVFLCAVVSAWLLSGLSGSALGLFWVLPGSAHAGRWHSKRAVTSLLEALFCEVSGSNCSDCGTVNTGIAHRKILDRRSKPGPRNGADLACMGEEMGPSGCPHPLPLGWLL